MAQTTSIHMVDLAGSECYNYTRPHAQINVSLLALGRVLTALAKGHKHVPYRDSVLTRLLQGVLWDAKASHNGVPINGLLLSTVKSCRSTMALPRA